MRLLDLFCGRWGWSRAFAARGWECVGVDLTEPSEMPAGCQWYRADVLEMDVVRHSFKILARGPSIFGEVWCHEPDFVIASSPCEEFSVHGMKLFHPNPKYPATGIKLFNHTRALCEAAGVPYVMENVRAAQQFIGRAVYHCGPFYLWGSAAQEFVKNGVRWGTPVVDGLTKGSKFGAWTREQRKANKEPYYSSSSRGVKRDEIKAKMATIPPELANCVAEYAERILEQAGAARERT